MFDKLTLWDINIPQDPDGIPSYVRHVRFKSTPFPALEPGVLARILKTFMSLISLEFCHTRLPPPDELTVPLSLGEIGKGITRLTLAHIPDPAEVTTSFIFSFPNLKELVIDNIDDFWPDEPSLLVPDSSQREPLELFVLAGCMLGHCIPLTQWKLTSHRLSFNPSVKSTDLLLKISSKTVETLELIGT